MYLHARAHAHIHTRAREHTHARTHILTHLIEDDIFLNCIPECAYYVTKSNLQLQLYLSYIL